MLVVRPTLNPQPSTIKRQPPYLVAAAVIALLGIVIALAFYFAPKKAPESFLQSQKVTANADLRFTFPEKMDQQSAQENLIIPDGVDGTIRWEENEMIFHPSTPLKEGKKFKFVVLKNAKTADQEILEKNFPFEFIVAGIPTLAFRMPEKDAKEVSRDAKISLVFDRSIVPLTQVQGKAAEKKLSDWPVTITPDIPGRWRFVGTTTAIFEAKEGLTSATRYTVSVPPGITTVTDDKTTEDFSWSFETIRPKAISIAPFYPSIPEEEKDFALDQYSPKSQILLSFNLPIDLTSARQQIALVQKKENEEIPFPIGSIQYHTEDGKPLKETLVIQPGKDLEWATSYAFKISKDLKATDGDLGSVEEQEYFLNTAGDLIIEKATYEYFSIRIFFSNPIDGKTLKENLTITPEPANWKDFKLELTSWSQGKDLYFSPELKPSTSYIVTLNTGLKDLFGQNLKEPYTFEFKTFPIPSRVFIHSKGEFGIFEKNKPPVYYLNAVNVSRLDLEFARLSLAEMMDIQQAKNKKYDYAPSLSKYSDYQSLTLKPPKNIHDEWEAIEFDVEKQFKQKLKSGIYALTLKAPEIDPNTQKPLIDQQYFVLTDMAVTLKYSGTKVLVWVIDIQSGAPVKDAEIVFHSLDNREPLKGKTDENGFFTNDLSLQDFQTTENYYPEFFVTALKDGDFAFVSNRWDSGMDAWQFGISSDFYDARREELQVESYVYTERPLYRAGDTVHFKGIMRLRSIKDGRMTLPKKNHKVNVRITDAQGKEIYEKTLDFSGTGSFNDSVIIASDASLGNYYLDSRMSGAALGRNYGGASFAVLAYRKPEYRVEVTTEKEDYFDDEVVKAEIEGTYYFGAPMSNAKVDWRAISTDYYFNRYTDGYYSFALEESWCYWYCERKTSPVTSGSGNLDATGHLKIQFPYNIDDKPVSQVMTIEADVYDPNNQIVSNRVSVPVHKSKVYVGIQTEDYAVAPGENARVALVTVNPDGTPFASQKVTVKLYSRVWKTIKKKGVDGGFYYDHSPEDTFIRETTVTTDDQGKTKAELLVEKGGQFRLVATTKDRDGREAKASTSVYAYSSTYFNWPQANNDRVDIIVDKPEYAVGDTAQLIVKSPYQGTTVKALVTVEREQIISKKVMTVESNAQAIEIPITEDLIPNAYVSVVIIKPRIGETFNENGLDTGVPAFKIGYAKLLVQTSRKKLSLTIETDKPKYGPGETVNVKLKALDWQNKPVKAELSLGVVDMSVLALTGFTLPDLVKVFYSERPLGIRNAESLLYLIERFKPGSKGGGGAEAETKKRETFKDTAYWNPLIATDNNGEASLSFKLPDNLTTWQLLTIAHTKENTFGAKAETIIETKKVIIRPVRPRFAVADDEIKLGAIVHNFLPDSKTFTVTLKGSGFSSLGKMEQSIELKPEAQEKLIFPVKVNYGEKVTMIFKAEVEGALDEIEESIPVYIFGTPQTVATSGQTEKAAIESVLVPTKEEAKEGNVSITIAPTLGTYLPKGLEYVLHYPYGCAEQVMSSFLPALSLKGLQGFDAFQIVDDKTLENVINVGLQKLYSFQRPDGGFGYWQGGEKSYPYLTAYILYGLEVAKQFKHPIDDGVIDRARKYLDDALRFLKLDEPIDITTRAFILFVLSETGSVDASLVNNLYDERDKLPVFAKAMLSMTLQKIGSKVSKQKADEILTKLLELTKVDARGTHFEEKDIGFWGALMNTNTRTTALVLQNLIRIHPDNPLIHRIVRYLLAVREDGHWDTTQSTSATILAFIDFLKSTGELDADYQAAIEVNGERVLNQTFNKENILTKAEVKRALSELKQGQENEIKMGKQGPGILYYDLLMNYFYLADTIEPAEEGIGILREMAAFDDKEYKSEVEGAKLGETYRVKLTITVPQDRHFVAIESPLPAGLEAIDLKLKTTQQTLLKGKVNVEEAGYDGEIFEGEAFFYEDYYWSNLWYFNHIEFRDDRVFMFADYLPTGVYEYEYLVRATTPGNYRQRPARAFEMYFPETFGQTGGKWFTVE